MSQLRLIVIGMLGCALSAGGAQPADRAPSAAPVATDRVAALPDGDVRDVLLLLDDGPLHLRFRVTLSGVSLAAARDAYVDKLLQKLDTNGDGKLSPDELARSPLAPPSRAGNAFLQSLDGKRGNASKDGRALLMQQVEKEGGETLVYREDTKASKNDQEVFKLLDTDKSGYLDRSEMAAAAARILERDQDQDECISFQEFLPEPEPDPSALLLVNRRPGAADRPTITRAEILRDISEPQLAGRLIKQYDKNRDGKLSPEELGWTAERVKMLDANSDGKLNEKELKGIAQTPVDLELAIDLNGAPDGQPAIVILSSAGNRVDDGKRPDLVRLAFARAVLTLSFRKVDSLKAAIESAMRTFNQLDADGNGYLDRKETAPAGIVTRFQTEKLFDALDADGDGKIFGEEMEKYVTVRAEPFASTAKVNLYDTGRGFFEALDTNGDGRISMREMKAASRSLQNLARRNSEKLSPEDPARNFHIEFMRGSFSLFKQQADLAAAPTTTFEQREPIGPTWFQRMDRNNDGDLTWNEFLGPREVFHRIDKDGDGLIDPQEAFEANDE